MRFFLKLYPNLKVPQKIAYQYDAFVNIAF